MYYIYPTPSEMIMVLVQFRDKKIAMVNKNKVKCDIEKVGGTCTVLWGKRSYDAKVLGIGMLDIL